MMPSIRNEKGFSLLELLIAVSVLALGLMAVAAMQATAIGATGIANRNTDIASLAQQAMEDVMGLSSSDAMLKTGRTWDYDLDPKSAGTSITVPGSGIYTAKCIVTPSNPVPGVSRIEVTVNRQNSLTTPIVQSFTMTAYKRVE